MKAVVLSALEMALLGVAAVFLVPPPRSESEVFHFGRAGVLAVLCYATAQLLSRRRGRTRLWMDAIYVIGFACFALLVYHCSLMWQEPLAT